MQFKLLNSYIFPYMHVKGTGPYGEDPEIGTGTDTLGTLFFFDYRVWSTKI